MELLSVITAAVAGYAFGAVWYMTLSKPWVEAAGIEVDGSGRPVNQSATPFILAGIANLVVAWQLGDSPRPVSSAVWESVCSSFRRGS